MPPLSTAHTRCIIITHTQAQAQAQAQTQAQAQAQTQTQTQTQRRMPISSLRTLANVAIVNGCPTSAAAVFVHRRGPSWRLPYTRRASEITYPGAAAPAPASEAREEEAVEEEEVDEAEEGETWNWNPAFTRAWLLVWRERMDERYIRIFAL